MENSSPLILEISSDEEVGFGDTRKDGGYGVGGGGFGDRDDCDWLSELFVEVGGNKDVDSEDVVLVSETFPNPLKNPRLEPLNPSTKVVGADGGGGDDDDDDDDDDDCVVLDGDPDKLVAAANCKVDNNDNYGDDGVEIVSEKGEVACRDFPHARHLCAKFLFASTSHEVHCSQCHCYVCDSLAPCSHWGTGVSSIDHCHATDKDEYWRAERKRMRKGYNPVPSVPLINNNSPLGAFFRPTQTLGPPRPVAARVSSMPPNVSEANAINQGRAHPSGCAIPFDRPRPQVVLKNPVPKQRRFVGASPNNIYHPYGSQLSRNPLSNVSDRNKSPFKRCRVFHGTTYQHQQNTTHRPVRSVQQVNSPQGINVRRANYVPSRSHIHSRPYSGSVIRAPIHRQSQSQTHIQPYTNSNNFVSAVPLQQPHVGSQPSVENLVLPQPHMFQPNSSVNACNPFGSELNLRFMIPSDQSAGNNLGNQSSQPQAHVNPPSLLFNNPNDFEQGHHTQNGLGLRPNDFGLAWDSSLIRPADNSQLLHGVNESDNRQSIEPTGNYQQGVVVTGSTSLTNEDVVCQFPESVTHDTFDFQFDNWMFENHSLSGVVEVPVSPLWNGVTPEPASVDKGNLFDL